MAGIDSGVGPGHSCFVARLVACWLGAASRGGAGVARAGRGMETQANLLGSGRQAWARQCADGPAWLGVGSARPSRQGVVGLG